jgi:hypothetical protein
MPSMDKGENQIICKLCQEAMLPLTDWQHDHRVGSKRQAATQIIILYLHEHRYLSDALLNQIKERTKIFETDEYFNKQKLLKHQEKIIEKEKIETVIWKG